MEEQLQAKRHELSTKIRAVYLGYIFKKRYQNIRNNLIKVQSVVRMHQATNKYQKTIKKITVVSKHIRGHLQRKRYKVMKLKQPKYAVRVIQNFWRSQLRKNFLHDVKEAVIEAGKNWNTISWPPSTKTTASTSALLRKIYAACMAKIYRANLNPERKKLLQLKVIASDFCKLKVSYRNSYSND